MTWFKFNDVLQKRTTAILRVEEEGACCANSSDLETAAVYSSETYSITCHIQEHSNPRSHLHDILKFHVFCNDL